MKKKRHIGPALAILMMLLLRTGAAWGQAWTWGTRPGLGEGFGTAVDAAGNVYVTGTFSGSALFGATTLLSAGQRDVFVAKYSATGTPLWAVRGGSVAADDYGLGIALDPMGRVVVTGGGAGLVSLGTFQLNLGPDAGLFVARLTAATGAWLTADGAAGGTSEAVTVDAGGNVYIAGTVRLAPLTLGTTTIPGNGRRQIFVAKLGVNGGWRWATSARSGGIASVWGIAVDSAGSAALTGDYDGSAFTIGATTLVNQGSQNLYVARLTPAGAWQWAAGAGANPYTFGRSLTAGPGGSLYVGGEFEGPTAQFGALTLINSSTAVGRSDAFVAQLSPTGQWQWVARTTGPGSETVTALATDSLGRIYAAGVYQGGPVSFGAIVRLNRAYEDVFVATLDGATHTWQNATTAGGNGSDIPASVAATGRGAVYLTGYSNSSTLTFGPTTLLHLGPVGEANAFVARLGAPPLALAAEALPALSHSLTLFPNPAHRTVRLTGALAPTAILLDALGRTVRTWPLEPTSSDLDLTGLAPGLYTVRAGAAARRLVVE